MQGLRTEEGTEERIPRGCLEEQDRHVLDGSEGYHRKHKQLRLHISLLQRVFQRENNKGSS